MADKGSAKTPGARPARPKAATPKAAAAKAGPKTAKPAPAPAAKAARPALKPAPKLAHTPAPYAVDAAPGLPPWFLKAVAWTGAIGVLTANLSAMIPHIASLRTGLQETFGLLAFENVSSVAGWLIVLGVGAGYFCGCALLYFLWVRRKAAFRLPFLIGAAVLAPVVLILSLNLRPTSDLSGMQAERLGELSALVDQGYVESSAGQGGYWFSTENSGMGPQGWTTAQVVAGVLQAPSTRAGRAADVQRVRRSLAYLQSIREPTGWGYQDGAKITVTEIIGWATVAEALALREDPNGPIWTAAETPAAVDRLFVDLEELARRQHSDGGYGPLSPTSAREHQRTYSTVVALMAILAARDLEAVREDSRWTYDNGVRRGARWLLMNATAGEGGERGWWPNPYMRRVGGDDCLGLTSQVMYVLARTEQAVGLTPYEDTFGGLRTAYLRRLREGDGQILPIHKRPLDVNCQLHDGESYLFGQADFTLERSTFLWFPWTMAAVTELRQADGLSSGDRNRLAVLDDILTRRLPEMTELDRDSPVLYPTAETLFGLGAHMRARPAAAD